MGFEGQFDGTATGNKNKRRIRLDADAGDLILGGDGSGGDLKVSDDKGLTKIRLDAGGLDVAVAELKTETILLAGASGTISAGALVLTNLTQTTIESAGGEMSVGNKDVDDFVLLKGKGRKHRVHLDAGGEISGWAVTELTAV